MAIQTINLTVPGGDTPRSANTKINANFSDTTHAASKLVGTAAGQVPLSEDVQTIVGMRPKRTAVLDFDALTAGIYNIDSGGATRLPWGHRYAHVFHYETVQDGYDIQISYPTLGSYAKSPRYRIRDTGVWQEWNIFYNTGNTKLDTNGAIAPSSPTIDLYSDRIETNTDGARMNPEFIRNGVGDYTIKNTTGLRDEGWYIKIPNDMNGNPKVAVAVDTDKDGNLSIKTYRRIFSMETFIFIPDLETPLDIPEGRWIDLRFNDLPIDESADMPAQQTNN